MKRVILVFFVSLAISLLLPTRSTAQWVKTGGPEDSISELKVWGGNLFAISEEGLCLSEDNGESWTQVGSGMEDTTFTNIAVSRTDLFASDYDAVFLSKDNGKTWQMTGSGPEDILCLAAGETHLFAGTYGGVFVTTDLGQSWKTASSGLPRDPFYGSPCFIKKIVIVGATLFALTGDFYEGESCGVFTSTDNGNKWRLLCPQFLGNPIVMDLMAKEANLFIGFNSGVFRSADYGKTWLKPGSKFPFKEATLGGEKLSYTEGTVVFALIAIGTSLVAGTDKGVYFSTDEGENWLGLNSGLPEDMYVMCFAVNGEYLFAGTSSAGVWRMPLSEVLMAER